MVLLGICLLGTCTFLLLRPAIPLNLRPFPDTAEYSNSAYRLAHGEGYTTTVKDEPIHTGVNPPRYPPGYPLVLAPFAAVGHFPADVEFGEKTIVAALVVVVALAALDLAGPWAAIVATLLVFSTPFVRQMDRLVLSDALGVLLTVALLPLIRRSSPRLTVLAGLVAGYGVVVRFAGLVVLACLLIALPGVRRRMLALAGAVPPLLGLVIYQWSTFGQPWGTGYGYWLPGFKIFSLAFVTKHPAQGDGPFAVYDQVNQHLAHWTCHVFRCVGAPAGGAAGSLPNWFFYPLVLAGAFWMVTPPLVALLGWLVALRLWRDPVAQFALLLPILTLGFYLTYFYQAARFMAPAAFVLIVFAATAVPRAVSQSGNDSTRFRGAPDAWSDS